MRSLDNIEKHFPYLIQEGEVKSKMERIINTDEPIFITGATGLGKSFISKCIHLDSDRNGEKYTDVSLSSLPSTLFEAELFGHKKGSFTGAGARLGLIEYTDRGTLVLEDITELSLENQAKFLQFLDTFHIRQLGSNLQKKVDVRLIVTTNRSIIPYVESGKFRQDLYYRLASGFSFEMPKMILIPRPMFYQILCKKIHKVRKKYGVFLNYNREAPKFTFDDNLLDTLKSKISGNWRGINRVANHFAFLDTDHFTFKHLPSDVKTFDYHVKESGTLYDRLRPIEYRLIKEAMIESNHNQVRACEVLGVSRNTLRNRLRDMKYQSPMKVKNNEHDNATKISI